MKPSARVLAAKAVLVDLDGCLAAGNVPLPGAVALAGALGERLFIVSNNSTEDAALLALELRRHGLPVAPRRILLAGEHAVAVVARAHPGARVLLAGNATLARHAAAAGLRLTQERPQVVLLARDTSFSYRKLERIARALADGATLVAANPDLTHPGPGGRPVPETGALLAAVRATAPGHAVHVVGKPSADLFQAALARAGVRDPGEALMVGDNPATDLAGAQALGIPTLLVGAAPGAEAASLGELLESPPPETRLPA